MTLRYWTDNETWLHSFQLLRLEEEDIQTLVSQAGFGRVEWLNQDKTKLSRRKLGHGGLRWRGRQCYTGSELMSSGVDRPTADRRSWRGLLAYA